MITLSTLPQATAQEVFNQVAIHLLTQNRQCKDERGRCAYWHEELRCAAGCLIGYKEYHLDFEGKDWIGLTSNLGVPSDHDNLISDLQTVHDEFRPTQWVDELREVATVYELNTEMLQPWITGN